MERFNEALEDFDIAGRLNPKHTDTYFHRGNAYMELGQYETAIADYNKVLQINPNDYRCREQRHSAISMLNHDIESLEQEGIEYVGDPVEEISVLDSQKSSSKQIVYFDDSVGDDDDDAEWFGDDEFDDDEMAEIEAADKMIQENPENLDAFLMRGIAKNNVFDWEGALPDFEKVLEFQPDNVEALNGRGVAKSEIGMHEEAHQDFEKAIELDDKNPMTYYNKGLTEMSLGLYEEAINLFNKVIELDPNDPRGYTVRSMAYERTW